MKTILEEIEEASESKYDSESSSADIDGVNVTEEESKQSLQDPNANI